MSVPETPAEAVARFAADWESALRGDRPEPPALGHYVPDGSEARLAVLTDLVRVDLRQRWHRTGAGKRILEYGKEFPEVAASPQFVELVCEEFLVSRRYRPVDLDAFTADYPEELAAAIRERLTGAEPMAAARLPDHIETGRRLDDFDLLTDLGGDAASRVFLARQRSMQRLVAVRVQADADGDAPRVAQLDHQYIVRVFDQRRIEDGGKPLRLLYMQYLPGGAASGVLERLREQGTREGGELLLKSVDAAMESRGEIRPTDSRVRAEIAELSWPETIAWVGRRLALALDYAERHGVQHHDIRPDNVLFTVEGVPKLADFALGPLHPGYGDIRCAAAKDIEALAYYSPERLAALLDPAARVPDTRSDIYSLGVLLWEMLTGATPFDDTHAVAAADVGPDDLTDLMLRRRAGVPESALAALPADTPPALRRVLLECLDPDPARRWQTGAELAGQLDVCLDARARDLVDPPPTSLRHRARGWLLPIAVLCVLVPNALASLYNVRLNQRLIIDRLSDADQHRFDLVVLVNNAVAFPLAALLLVWLCRRPLAVPLRLARGHVYTPAELARARADTLTMGDRGVWVPFGMWVLAGIGWPLALAGSGVSLPPSTFAHFFAAQIVCALIALAYPFFLITVYAVRSLYPQLLVRGGIGPADGRQLWALARRSNFYLAVAASVPLVGAASATFVSASDLESVLVPVRWLSVGGILAFVITYWLFRLLEADLQALVRVIPRGAR
ncbi:protein kinase [Nocardia sp. NPDC050406]|uniref:protein kinase domain-containing protein n=1 Tax=Nocardia sp. NPDC050406 TaxID=3364318 RepID=UPI00378A3940